MAGGTNCTTNILGGTLDGRAAMGGRHAAEVTAPTSGSRTTGDNQRHFVE